MNWLITAGAAYGIVFLCMALYSMATLRGKPVLLDNRWFSIPSSWFTLYYFWIELSSEYWTKWGMDDSLGWTVGIAVATLGMFAVVRVFPSHWGGLVLLGVDRAEVRLMMKGALRELDSGARLKKEQWYSEVYAAEAMTLDFLGKSILRIRFSGAGASELSNDMLPILRHDFTELGLVGGTEAVAFARRVVWMFLALLVGLMLLAWLGYTYSHSLREA